MWLQSYAHRALDVCVGPSLTLSSSFTVAQCQLIGNNLCKVSARRVPVPLRYTELF